MFIRGLRGLQIIPDKKQLITKNRSYIIRSLQVLSVQEFPFGSHITITIPTEKQIIPKKELQRSLQVLAPSSLPWLPQESGPSLGAFTRRTTVYKLYWDLIWGPLFFESS